MQTFMQVRDFSFNPDTGALSKVMYDDFGLSFLPASFFDTFSMAMADVVAIGPSGVIVVDEAKYRERRCELQCVEVWVEGAYSGHHTVMGAAVHF